MKNALVATLVALGLIGPLAVSAWGETLVAPSGASAELRNTIRRECAARTRRPWPYGPEGDLGRAAFEGRSTKGFLFRTAQSTVKPVPEQEGGLLAAVESREGAVPAGELTDRFVFCLLLNGYRWQSSEEDGVATLRRLAEHGHREAQTTLGVAYFYGEFVKSDHNEGVRWFRHAAEQRHPTAELYLGIAYANGEGVPTDRHEAVRWLRKAAAQGQQRAADLLARYRKEFEEEPAPLDAREVERLRRSADEGGRDAQLALAALYEDGRGVPRDIAEALRWYRASAEAGSVKAQTYLGEVYEKGRGIQQDDREAVRWYRRAAEQGEPRAQYSLGVLLIKGRGEERDETQGWTWIRRAAERGHPAAQEVLRRKR